jgi:hypothetical protein
VAYFAPQARAEWRRAHAPELDILMTRAIMWAGGPPPQEIPECPRSVEVRLFHSEKRRAFHLRICTIASWWSMSDNTSRTGFLPIGRVS